MFCDLAGSTSLAAKLDPEDWRNLVNAYLDEASKAVTALGGHVLKRLGDGLMALFGYPQAQENDAERAVRAALAIQRALAEINDKNRGKGAPDLLARIGIESGPVVVEATGEVFGDAPNVAARLQAAAEPGSVLVTMNVQRQVAGLFVAEEQGARELKGVTEPVQLFRIVRASGGGRRSGARVLTPFVGREEELGLLARRWERCRAGEGQLALIVGEPGLGKSRIIEEFHTRLAEAPHTWVEWSASQLLQNTPLHPVAEWGRQRFGVDDAPAEQRLADLENTLRLVGLDPAEYAPLVAPLVDIPLPPARAANFPPEEMRRRQLAAMTNLVLAGARSQPVVLAFEDLHWADPTSLDLLRALADRGAQAPLLLLATTRPEFRAPWSLRSHHIVISLSPLDRAGVAQMVGEISSRHALSREVVDGVTERTGGVPLFVEEVTRLLLERGEQGGVQAIPPTLQQSLAARLDRLGPAREVAQIGAVLGREFGYPLLRDIADLDEPALQASLDRLADADLLFVEGAPPQASYRFKHALIQDAAYDSLLKSRRQALHRRAAELLRDDPERAAAEPEVIAHHFTQAALEDLAIEWWGKAGDQALRRSAFQEAIAHLGKAIAMADRAEGGEVQRKAGSPAHSSQRLKLQADYGRAIMWSKGYGADETKVAFARAGELAARTGDASQRFAAYYADCVGSLVRGEYRASRKTAEEFLSQAEGEGRAAEAVVARRMLGSIRLFQGELRDADAFFRRALADYTPDAQFRYGTDAGISAESHLALAEWHLGELRTARERVQRAIEHANRLGHSPTIAYACFSDVFMEAWPDPEALERASTTLLKFAQVSGLPYFIASGEIFRRWAQCQFNGSDHRRSSLRQAVMSYIEQGNKLFATRYYGFLAEVEVQTQSGEKALALIDEGLSLADSNGEHLWDPYLYRLRGDILLKRNPADPGPTEEAYRTAIAIAKEQGARSYELLASLSLAKLYQSTSRPAEAHAVLAPALEGFAPTPEMPQIGEAQALLATLAATEEVKAAIAQQERRFRLQTAYGEAMMWSKGFAADPTKVAFARASELAGKTEAFHERFEASLKQWAAAITSGELNFAQEIALGLLRTAEDAGRVVAISIANRALGLVAFFHGDFAEARAHLERALETGDPSCDPRFWDDRPNASSYLAVTVWALGEVERGRELIDVATGRATEIGDIRRVLETLFLKSYLEIRRGDPLATLSAAEALERVAREYGTMQYLNEAELHSGWARGRIDDPVAGAAQVRRVLAAFVDQHVKINLGFYTGLLAELEAETLGADSALARIGEAFRLSNQVELRCSLPFLHRLRGEILLKRDPSDPAPAEEAFRTSIAIAKEQGARSPVLLASLPLAKLLQSIGRFAEAHALLVPALEGFSPTPEMPEIAEAQALLAALAETEEVKAAEAQRQRRVHLQTAYGQAMMWAKGFGADETLAAYARARELAAEGGADEDRYAIYYGQWLGLQNRGELRQSRATAEAFLADAAAAGKRMETAVAHRALALNCFLLGEFAVARFHADRAIKLDDPARSAESRFRFSVDCRTTALCYLALANWHLGEVYEASRLFQEALTQATTSGHVQTVVNTGSYKAALDAVRGDAEAADRIASIVFALSREHGMEYYIAWSEMPLLWARSRMGNRAAEASKLRQTIANFMAGGHRLFAPFYTGLLAELAAGGPDPNDAQAQIDAAITLAQQTGERWADSMLHRIRGDILLKRDPTNPAPAEEVFQTALAIARQQGSRSFGLQAALALAKLYQSNARPADANAVLAPALEGFSPTPEMPEIAEAQALLAALAETDDVKAQAAQRERRLHLQTAYGNALIGARGHSAPETTDAFAKARELAFGEKGVPERLAAVYGLWAGSLARGELSSMRERAAALLGDVEVRGDSPEAGVAHRTAGSTHWFAGEYVEARKHLERALALFQPGRDDDLAFRFGQDPGVVAMLYLALVLWPLGDVGRAVSLIGRAQRRIARVSHIGTRACGKTYVALLELLRGDRSRTAPNAVEVARLTGECDLPTWRAFAVFLEGMARAESGALAGGLEDMHRGVELLRERNVLIFDGFLKIALAEAESRAGDVSRALAILDEALATSERIGHRTFDAELHRVRGEMLLRRDPANHEAAQEALHAAIAVAKQQSTRSFGLRAALSLAKLYQSTPRPAQAHAVLAPALEGFSPTPEMPEIAEAQALLESLAHGGEGAIASKHQATEG
jgi:class 3 adenylate cyclase/predicted ATPase